MSYKRQCDFCDKLSDPKSGDDYRIYIANSKEKWDYNACRECIDQGIQFKRITEGLLIKKVLGETRLLSPSEIEKETVDEEA